MAIKVGINGFGRIGRLFFRQASAAGFDIVGINDLGDIKNLAYLLTYDSVYGRYPENVSADPEKKVLRIGSKEVPVFSEKDPAVLPWDKLNADVVVECTGVFDSFAGAAAHLKSGAKHVVISAPAKDPEGTSNGRTVLMGVNPEDIYKTSLTSNGSCTTNATAPIISILSESLGIEKAILSTVHAYTATQSLVDGPVKGSDYRRGRAAAQNISPSSTGAAETVGRVIPKISGKFDGLAFRTPVIAGSMADITFIASRPTTVTEVNNILKTAVASPRWQETVAVTEDQLTSSDIIGQPYGAIIDLSFTRVVDGTLVKILSWYDNEWGYTSTLLRHVLSAGTVKPPVPSQTNSA